MLWLTGFKQTLAPSASAAHPRRIAIRLAQGCRFDLYVLDQRFPDGTGVELCSKIREFDPFALIIIYSGAAYESDRNEALHAGARAYLVKPAVDELVETVNRLLDESDGAVI